MARPTNEDVCNGRV